MKKSKLLGIVVLVIFIFAFVFSGCNKDSETVTTSETKDSGMTEETSEAMETEETAPPSEIVLGWWIQSDKPADFQKVFDAVNEHLLEKANAKIVDFVNMNFGNYRDQLTLILSGSEHLDAFACYRVDFANYASKGQIIPLDDLLEEYGQGIIDAVGWKYLDAGKIGGAQYGLTTNRDLAMDYGYVMVKSLVDEYGFDLDAVETNDDMEPIFQTILENEEGMVPFAMYQGSRPMADYFVSCDPLSDYFGVLMNYGWDDLKVVNLFATQEYKDYVYQMRDWYNKGYILKDGLTISDYPNDLLKAGRAFSTFSNLKPGFDIKQSALVGVPVVSVDVTETHTNTAIPQTMQWCIANNSVDPEGTMRVLNVFYSDAEVMNLLAWGIEDEHYVFTEDGHITYPEGVTSDTIGYDLNQGWLFGNQYLTHVWEGDPIDLYDQLETWNNSATASKAYGFTYDSTPVKTEVAAVTNVCNEFRKGLEFGVVDPEGTLEEFLSRLEAAGIDKIIAEKQRQLDEWANGQ